MDCQLSVKNITTNLEEHSFPANPSPGINHKEYGVTSLGINVYMHKVLEYMGIHPEKDDLYCQNVRWTRWRCGRQSIAQSLSFLSQTAKVIALTDGTGTIHDDQGLDLVSS